MVVLEHCPPVSEKGWDVVLSSPSTDGKEAAG